MKINPLKENEAKELVLNDSTIREYYFNNAKDWKYFSFFKEKGMFSPKHNPKPIQVKNGFQIPQWDVLPYLERISNNTRDLDNELLEIIKEVSLYKDRKGKHVDNYRTWWFFVKILLNIPLKSISLEFFTTIIPVWLTSIFDLTLPGSDLTNKLLPEYLKQAESAEDIKKVEFLIKLLLSISTPKKKKNILGTTTEVRTKIDKYWLEESFLVKNNATLIVQKCSNTPIFYLADIIKKILKKHYTKDDYSYIWLNDLSKEQNKPLHDGEYFLAVILRKLVLEKGKINVDDGSEIIRKFISNSYPHYLFKRLALLLIGNYWEKYNKYFDQIIGNKNNYFDIDAYYPEMSHLLINNASKLTKEQKTRLISIFKKGPSQYLPSKKIDEYKNYWKQRWYKTLIELPEFKQLHDGIKEITKKEIVERREESGWINFDKSPISAEQLLQIDNKDIVKYIKDYKPIGEFPDSSPEGIQRVFQSAVKQEPEKFVRDLNPFKETDYYTISSLFSGLKEAWIEKKNFNWKNVIEYIISLIKGNNFWKPSDTSTKAPYNYFDWAISSIGYLLQEGSKSDEWAFDESLHEQVELIIATINKNLNDKDSPYHGDGVTYALNSSWGKILTALIYLGLREARLSDKRNEHKISKWSDVLKANYEAALTKNIDEAYTLLGQYLPNLHYIDKDWVETKAKEIYKLKDDNLFETFMDGYLFSGRVYEVLYKVLTKSYERALTFHFKESRIEERLIQHIAVGYLRGNEKLGENSLIDKIIQQDNSDHVREIIEFLWHQREYVLDRSNEKDKEVLKEKEEFEKRIIFFWDYIISYYKTKKKPLSESDKKALSELSKLAVYVPVINKKIYSRLLLSAPFVTFDFDSPFFIEYLNNLKDKGDKKESAEYVAMLFIKMINNAKVLIPDFDWSHIEQIIQYLYSVNDKKIKNLTNQICNIYADHKNFNLRHLYEENN
ncbi:MAG: hypothetical protein KJ915_08740 [Candidatus Omnitrophica bacterium]|nr:hypothetical protein [Candidatus Omnitrophota bacterium]